MSVQHITDPSDPRVHEYFHLTDMALRTRREPAEGLFIAESDKVIRRALRAGHRPRSYLMGQRWVTDLADLVADAAAQDVPVYVAEAEVLQTLTGFKMHRGVLAAMHRPVPLDPADLIANSCRLAVLEDVVDHTDVACCKTRSEEPQVSRPPRARIAVLENLVDHTNVGALFRSAAALGIDAVLITPQCADPLYRRSIRVSMGTVFQVPWARIDPWPSGVNLLKEAGYVVAGMTLGEDAVSLDELVAQDHPRLALVFGAEGDGLSPRTSAVVDVRVKIPMMGGVDSLNVAASSAVAFYATR